MDTLTIEISCNVTPDVYTPNDVLNLPKAAHLEGALAGGYWECGNQDSYQELPALLAEIHHRARSAEPDCRFFLFSGDTAWQRGPVAERSSYSHQLQRPGHMSGNTPAFCEQRVRHGLEFKDFVCWDIDHIGTENSARLSRESKAVTLAITNRNHFAVQSLLASGWAWEEIVPEPFLQAAIKHRWIVLRPYSAYSEAENGFSGIGSLGQLVRLC